MPKMRLTCDSCGKEYFRYVYGDKPNHFCSQKCKGAFISKKQHGENNPSWVGGKGNYDCIVCGANFLAYKSEHDRGGAKYCSRQCGYSDKAKPRVTTDCQICGNSFSRSEYNLSRRMGAFCSKSCFGEWISTYRSGKNSPIYGIEFSVDRLSRLYETAPRGKYHYNWKGGITKENRKVRNSLEMSNWQRSVFSADDWTCQGCGKRGGYLHAHHVMGFAAYPELRFDAKNGVTLCRECHLPSHTVVKSLLGDPSFYPDGGIIEIVLGIRPGVGGESPLSHIPSAGPTK